MFSVLTHWDDQCAMRIVDDGQSNRRIVIMFAPRSWKIWPFRACQTLRRIRSPVVAELSPILHNPALTSSLNDGILLTISVIAVFLTSHIHIPSPSDLPFLLSLSTTLPPMLPLPSTASLFVHLISPPFTTVEFAHARATASPCRPQHRRQTFHVVLIGLLCIVPNVITSRSCI